MAVSPKRYEIYFADLNPTVGGEIKKVRPVVVVSQNEMNRYLDTVVVCPLTSTLHPQWRSRLQIRCAGKDAEIAVDQIRTVSETKSQASPKNCRINKRRLAPATFLTPTSFARRADCAVARFT